MKTGVIAGNFDVIHPGYIRMFNECKQYCDKLHLLLHIDPSEERPHKLQPILDVWDRTLILSSLKQVDTITTYRFEKDLINHLKRTNPDIRFLGDDYKGKTYTGFELNIPIHYLDRSHGWSTTKFKKLIAESYEKNSSNSIRVL